MGIVSLLHHRSGLSFPKTSAHIFPKYMGTVLLDLIVFEPGDVTGCLMCEM